MFVRVLINFQLNLLQPDERKILEIFIGIKSLIRRPTMICHDCNNK